ncbi:MAG: HD domain-containing protein [Candidatus Omnitrophica bacterium]|nr:HD domain-containing protein [Candidatus Omnitrophota bacterium]
MSKKLPRRSLKSLLGLISEAGMLKQVQRSGWSVLGIKNGESVAEHSFRCVLIGYLISKAERARTDKVLLMTLFNDLPEARITDLHKMAQRYLEIQAAEDQSFAEQISALPKDIKGELKQLHQEFRRQKSKESIIARDADILECLLQAKTYQEQGFIQAAKFMHKAPRFLKTKTARNLWRLAKSSNLSNWWPSLTNFKR